MNYTYIIRVKRLIRRPTALSSKFIHSFPKGCVLQILKQSWILIIWYLLIRVCDNYIFWGVRFKRPRVFFFFFHKKKKCHLFILVYYCNDPKRGVLHLWNPKLPREAHENVFIRNNLSSMCRDIFPHSRLLDAYLLKIR